MDSRLTAGFLVAGARKPAKRKTTRKPTKKPKTTRARGRVSNLLLSPHEVGGRRKAPAKRRATKAKAPARRKRAGMADIESVHEIGGRRKAPAKRRATKAKAPARRRAGVANRESVHEIGGRRKTTVKRKAPARKAPAKRRGRGFFDDLLSGVNKVADTVGHVASTALPIVAMAGAKPKKPPTQLQILKKEVTKARNRAQRRLKDFVLDEEQRMINRGESKESIREGKKEFIKAQKERIQAIEHAAILNALNKEFPI